MDPNWAEIGVFVTILSVIVGWIWTISKSSSTEKEKIWGEIVKHKDERILEDAKIREELMRFVVGSSEKYLQREDLRSLEAAITEMRTDIKGLSSFLQENLVKLIERK